MDSLVCCVRENPEPICFSIACYGVRPELELDRKQVHFEKVGDVHSIECCLNQTNFCHL